MKKRTLGVLIDTHFGQTLLPPNANVLVQLRDGFYH